jgi:hypothetical protein
VEKTSRHRSRDPVASGVMCGPRGGKNGKMKSWTVSWLSLKTKVEPGLCGSRVMSGDWRRLHRVDGGAAAPDRSNQWVWPVGIGLTGEEHWSDRCATTQSGDFEAEDKHRDRKACLEAKQVCGRWASV